MNAFEGIINDLNERDLNLIKNETTKNVNAIFAKLGNFRRRIETALETYKQTGIEPTINFRNWEGDEDDQTDLNNDNSNERNSHKENINPAENTTVRSLRSRRKNTSTLKDVTQAESSSGVVIKKEKSSVVKVENLEEQVVVKTENEEMPAPTRPAPRKKRQNKSTMKFKIKEEKIDEVVEEAPVNGDDSDVVIVENKTIINLLDSDDNEKTLKNEEVNSKRKTRQKKKGGKRTRIPSSDEENMENADKRSRSDSPANTSVNETNYEDANSHLEENKETNNATFIAEKSVNKNLPSSNPVNVTMVIPNPKFAPVTGKDLLTDDESEDEKKKKKTPPKTVTKVASKSTKQIFSPFEPSPVKKKIQAFEKLREDNNAIPVRVTRTKSKMKAKEQEEEAKQEEAKSSNKEKAKFITPMPSKFIPGASSTVLKTNKLATPSSSNESLSTTKLSALKVSQIEYKEREKRRKEKEDEALKKREALLQAQIEERKKKREEKQLKAQQQREALEKEKLKALELQRLKDERHKQLIAEQEEKKQKLKEETEKKRLMVKMRAIEEKKKEEERRMEEMKKTAEISAKLAKHDEEMARLVQKQKKQREQQKQAPLYMKTKAPLLPTPDCYDSDSEMYEDGRRSLSTWDKKADLMALEVLTLAMADPIKNSFFSRQAQTPDLVDIFEMIEAQKLKRTSSAVWLKPPRYTMMLPLEEHDPFTDDDE